jgi:hypothetical protein
MPNNKECANNVGWSSEILANAISNGSVQARFNAMTTYWTIPNVAPSNLADVNQVTFWPGIQSTYTSPDFFLLQPEMWYTSNGSSSYFWWVQAQFCDQTGKNCPGVNFDVDANDVIEGQMSITAGSSGGNGDTWAISVQDFTHSNAGLIFAQTGSADPAFNQALFVQEVQGLWKCDGLLPSDRVQFQVNSISQEGTGSSGWSDQVDVLPSLSWTSQPGGQPPGPACDYSAFMDLAGGVYFATLGWIN